MFPIQDQISVVTKNSLEANLAMYISLSNKTLESIEKLINLNIAAAKASLEESSAASKQMLAAKDPQEFFSLMTAQSKPSLEKAIAYGNQVAGIANSAQAEFTKAAETQFTAMTNKLNELIEDATRITPAGTEGLVAMMKSSLNSTNSGYEQMAKTAKQAMEALGANLNGAVNQFAQAAGQKAAATVKN